jgi:hypothetical protein
MGTNNFWQFEFLKFMTALFLNFLNMWKILVADINKNYFGSHSTFHNIFLLYRENIQIQLKANNLFVMKVKLS